MAYSTQTHAHGLPIKRMRLRRRKESVAGAEFFGYYVLAMALFQSRPLTRPEPITIINAATTSCMNLKVTFSSKRTPM